jgi:hypothetical protein
LENTSAMLICYFNDSFQIENTYVQVLKCMNVKISRNIQ